MFVSALLLLVVVLALVLFPSLFHCRGSTCGDDADADADDAAAAVASEV